ncbi:MAG: cation:proton antiporter [Parvibaculum sp.]|jgi:CPA2 family monovalent cation:H+ antiporter-2|uniref:cation:proton antiporter n=1 Tax=Parvibaculum sp. TaxID=2024848 RepID=UPI0028506D54|nr:cation:proton antiporter [Parvibaculum sp.]MDR3498207.1 cation:proton antiporter [Parvibaculum sp.]
MEETLNLNSVTLLIVIALACGLVLIRLRQPAIVGYILAGVVLGPHGFGLVHNAEGIDFFAELGLLLLLFIVGLELSLQNFRLVYKVALLCAALQSAVAIGLTWALGSLLGWSFETSLILGFVLALSSTAVGIKMLQEIGEMDSDAGRITMGVLVAQDLLVIPMLVMAQSLGSGPVAGLGLTLALKLFGAVAVLAGVAIALTRRGRIELPWSNYLRSHGELAPLANLGFCFVFASLSGYVGLSPSYGAFLAGLILGASTDRRSAFFMVAPMQSVLLMVFFLSIGLLIDLNFVLAHLLTVLFLVFVVLIAKTAANITILNMLGESWDRAFISGLVMAQIGEFSFALAKAGLDSGAFDRSAYQLALSVIAFSLILSPFWLITARRFHEQGQLQLTGIIPTFESIYPAAFRAMRKAGASARAVAARLLRRRPERD